MRRKSKRYTKRFRPEKLISMREFLTGEHRTKEDLPKSLVIISNPNESNKPVVDDLTRKHLGSGKRPKWMDCPEEVLKEILAELKEIHGILSDWYRHKIEAIRRGE